MGNFKRNLDDFLAMLPKMSLETRPHCFPLKPNGPIQRMNLLALDVNEQREKIPCCHTR